MISFPFISTNTGALDAVFPLLVHVGPRPKGAPPRCVTQKDGKGKKVSKWTKAVPPIHEMVDGYIASILRELEASGIHVPAGVLPDSVRRMTTESGGAGADLLVWPIKIENISDYVSVTDSSTTVPANVPQFPHCAHGGDDTKVFKNMFHYKTSPQCECPIAFQASPGTTCPGPAREAVAFWGSPSSAAFMCRWLYIRHGQLHGVPCVLADIIVVLWRRGHRRLAEMLCNVYPSTSDPLAHLRPQGREGAPVPVAEGNEVDAEPMAGGVEDGDEEMPAAKELPAAEGEPEKKKGNAQRAQHAIRLKNFKDWLRKRERSATPLTRYCVPTAEDIYDLLKGTGLLIPADMVPGYPEVKLCDFWAAAVRYARILLDPSQLPDFSPQTIASVERLGHDVWVYYKSLMAVHCPWSAPPQAAWLIRLRKSDAGQAAQMERIRFAVNETCMAQAAHEFFVHGTRVLKLYGARAGRIHEEAFEHIFIYMWLVAFLMGKRHAHLQTRICSVMMVFWMAAWAGFPSIGGIRRREQKSRVY